MQDTAPRSNRHALLFILATAFLNLAGVGLIAPVSPFLVGQYTTSPADLAIANGLLFTAYSFFQFLALPGLGALSDRFGRRPVLLICLMGSAVGYLLLGIGGALWVLFLGRIIDGATGGNLGVITAFIADITEPEDRTRYFGLMGAVAGFGFVAGPALGGILSGFGGPTAPVFFAALVTFLNVIWGYFVMPESLPAEDRIDRIGVTQLNPFTQLWNIFKLPQLRWLMIAFFFAMLPFAALQSNLSVLSKDYLNWQAQDVAGIFTVVGVVGVIVQGGLIRVLLRKTGEIQLTIVGMALMAVGFLMIALIPAIPSGPLILVSSAVFAFGNGLLTPSLTGLISQTVGPRQQGQVQGGNMSVQAMARVLGPLWGSFTYVSIGAGSPYWTGAIMFGVAILCVIAAIPMLRQARAAVQQAEIKP
ncbi:MAG: MFS transporter [Anaerolineae bacterium]|nr:MFS transporter [Anaerolineae bacterium]